MPKLPHKDCLKRTNYIKQACRDVLKEKYPRDYNAILNEAARLFPTHAKPRYVEIESESTVVAV